MTQSRLLISLCNRNQRKTRTDDEASRSPVYKEWLGGESPNGFVRLRDAAGDEIWLLAIGTDEPAEVERSTVKSIFDEFGSVTCRTAKPITSATTKSLQKYGLGSAAAKTFTINYTYKSDVTGETSAISSTAARTVNKEFAVSYSEPAEDGKTYVNVIGSKLVYSLQAE